MKNKGLLEYIIFRLIQLFNERNRRQVEEQERVRRLYQRINQQTWPSRSYSPSSSNSYSPTPSNSISPSPSISSSSSISPSPSISPSMAPEEGDYE